MRLRPSRVLPLLALAAAVAACEGPTGPQGPPGPAGSPGPPGANQIRFVSFTRDCQRISGESWALSTITSACRVSHPECLAKVLILCASNSCTSAPVSGTSTQTDVSTTDANIVTHTLICVVR